MVAIQLCVRYALWTAFIKHIKEKCVKMPIN